MEKKSPSFDPRTTPYRLDLAAAEFEGRLSAKRFVTPTTQQVVYSSLRVHRDRSLSGPLTTQLLFGEIVSVYEEADGVAWIQCHRDRYVGYVRGSGLSSQVKPTTHFVSAMRSLAYANPSFDSPPVARLGMNARLRIEDTSDLFAKAEGLGWIPVFALSPIDERRPDWVVQAVLHAGTPYLWGGCDSSEGYDCSGLVQAALISTGRKCPRDTDQIRESVGEAVEFRRSTLEFGDLVFWEGHVGIMLDEKRLFHATADHMRALAEPLERVIEHRRKTRNQEVIAVRRI